MVDEVPIRTTRGRERCRARCLGSGHGLEVEQLYVLASHHGQGLGGQLLDLAIEKARERGLTYLWLGVWEHNTNAISLYRHRGYEEFDQHVFMFGGEEQRDVLMRLDLATASAHPAPTVGSVSARHGARQMHVGPGTLRQEPGLRSVRLRGACLGYAEVNCVGFTIAEPSV